MQMTTICLMESKKGNNYIKCKKINNLIPSKQKIFCILGASILFFLIVKCHKKGE